VREPWRFVPVPRNVVEKHRALHERLDHARRWAEGLPFNQATGDGDLGVLAAGFAYRKLLDVLGGDHVEGLRLLKLPALYPLPEVVVADFLSSCRRVLVLEENEPFVEDRLKVLAFDRSVHVEVLGKRSGHVVREGELFRWQIARALSSFLPGFKPAHTYRA